MITLPYVPVVISLPQSQAVYQEADEEIIQTIG